jgi:hypothetical protein
MAHRRDGEYRVPSELPGLGRAYGESGVRKRAVASLRGGSSPSATAQGGTFALSATVSGRDYGGRFCSPWPPSGRDDASITQLWPGPNVGPTRSLSEPGNWLDGQFNEATDSDQSLLPPSRPTTAPAPI